MRLWSIHPHYLDSKGLVAVWREGLLAQEVLTGRIKGYSNHPQLQRFRETEDAIASIGAYLLGIFTESKKRNFCFNEKKIHRGPWSGTIPVNQGQLEYEFRWLLEKIKSRDEKRYRDLLTVDRIEAHPVFAVRPGPIEPWERAKEHIK